MAKYRQKSNAVLFLFKLLLVVLNTALFAGVWYGFYSENIGLEFMDDAGCLMLLAFGLMSWIFSNLYRGFELTTSRITELVYSHTVALLVTHGFMYLIIWILTRTHLPAVLPLLGCLVGCILVGTLWSYLAYHITNKLIPPKRMLLIYENQTAYKSSMQIIRKYVNRFDFVGDIMAIRPVEDILEQIESSGVEAVMICGLPSSRRNDILKYCVEKDILAYVRPNIGDFLISNAQQFQMSNLPVMLYQRSCPSIFYVAAKRLMDILISSMALVILSPVMLVTAIAIKVSDGGPVLFSQKRMTINRKEFKIHKFRSMCVSADDGGKGLVTMKNDARITPVGKVIRACRIDELPQLFDILRGKMSIVGPRPERLETIELYERTMPEFSLRLQAKAGLTGYAQVYGKANTSPYDKLQMDLMYIGRQSLVTDLKIIFATIKVLFMPESTEGFEMPCDELQEEGAGTH